MVNRNNPSNLTSDVELVANVHSKANGVSRDSYRNLMGHTSNTILRGILSHMPTKLDIKRISESNGLPILSPDSMHLQQNLVESIKPAIKSCAAGRELKNLLKSGHIKRVPSFVETTDNDGNITGHRVYMYVDASCKMPEWWRKAPESRRKSSP